MAAVANREATPKELAESLGLLAEAIHAHWKLKPIILLKVYTVFDAEFSEYFGFTEDEVADMAAYYGVPEKMDEIKAARRKDANLGNLAAAALRQIRKHAYRAELESEGCGAIVSLGLAFCGKRAVLRKG